MSQLPIKVLLIEDNPRDVGLVKRAATAPYNAAHPRFFLQEYPRPLQSGSMLGQQP